MRKQINKIIGKKPKAKRIVKRGISLVRLSERLVNNNCNTGSYNRYNDYDYHDTYIEYRDGSRWQ